MDLENAVRCLLRTTPISLWCVLRAIPATELRRLRAAVDEVIGDVVEPGTHDPAACGECSPVHVPRTMSPDMAQMVEHIDNQRQSDGRGDLPIRG